MSQRIAVMKDGRVQQVATPRELYERPENAFVAGFIGTSNVLTVRPDSVSEGLVVMDLGEGDRICAPDTGVGSGGQMKIIVRPERMRVWGDPDGEGMSRVRGTIAEVVYLGSMTQLIIDLKTGERVTVHELNDDLKDALPQSGAPVVVQWAAESSFVIDDAGAVNVAARAASPE